MIDTAEEDVAVAANLRDHSAGSLVAMPEISSSDLTFTNQRLQVFDAFVAITTAAWSVLGAFGVK